MALLLISNGFVKAIWGVDISSVAPPAALMGSVRARGPFMPAYSIFVVAVATATFVGLDLLMRNSSLRKTAQALAGDLWFSSLAGVS